MNPLHAWLRYWSIYQIFVAQLLLPGTGWKSIKFYESGARRSPRHHLFLLSNITHQKVVVIYGKCLDQDTVPRIQQSHIGNMDFGRINITKILVQVIFFTLTWKGDVSRQKISILICHWNLITKNLNNWAC